jgi:hypothetical protein
MVSPGRDRVIGPRKSSRVHDARTLRNVECIGLALIAWFHRKGGEVVLLRGQYTCCTKQTNMLCTASRRYLCVNKNRRDALGEEAGPHVYKMKQMRTHTEAGSETVEQ